MTDDFGASAYYYCKGTIYTNEQSNAASKNREIFSLDRHAHGWPSAGIAAGNASAVNNDVLMGVNPFINIAKG